MAAWFVKAAICMDKWHLRQHDILTGSLSLSCVRAFELSVDLDCMGWISSSGRSNTNCSSWVQADACWDAWRPQCCCSSHACVVLVLTPLLCVL
jgi:hypothetical protein